MGNIVTETDGNGNAAARLVYGPIEKLMVWAAIAVVLLSLTTAGTTMVLVSQVRDARELVRENAQALHATAVVLERVVTKLGALEEWKSSVNVDDRYTSQDAARDRALATSERLALQESITVLTDRLFELAGTSADTATRLERLEALLRDAPSRPDQ